MTNDEIKSKQEETLKNLEKYNEDRKTNIVNYSEEGFYEEDEPIEDIEQAWNNAKIRGVTAKPTEKPPMQKWLNAQDELNKQRGISVVETNKEDLEKFRQEKELAPEVVEGVEEGYVPPLLCQYCGSVAYQGQIHGLGYCREKVQYQE